MAMGNLLRLSESASLALHVMVLLAQQGGQRSSTPELARRLEASPHTLAKVLQQLTRAGLVRAARGPKGGFALARPPRKISLLDTYQAVEGPLGKAQCLLGEPFCDGSRCVLGGLVEWVQREGRNYLSRTTLEDLARTIVLRARPRRRPPVQPHDRRRTR